MPPSSFLLGGTFLINQLLATSITCRDQVSQKCIREKNAYKSIFGRTPSKVLQGRMNHSRNTYRKNRDFANMLLRFRIYEVCKFRDLPRVQTGDRLANIEYRCDP